MSQKYYLDMKMWIELQSITSRGLTECATLIEAKLPATSQHYRKAYATSELAQHVI